MSDDRAPLIVACKEWKGERGPFDRLIEVERSDQDEVKIEACSTSGASTTFYLSRAAAEEIGAQLRKAAEEMWSS
jgi:hypothetical protein